MEKRCRVVGSLVMPLIGKILCILMLLGVLLQTAYADMTPNPRISYNGLPEQELTSIRKVCETVNELVKELGYSYKDESTDTTSITRKVEYFLDYSENENNVLIQVNMQEYKRLTDRERQKIMQLALNEVINSNISTTNRNKLYAEIETIDSKMAAVVRGSSNDVAGDFARMYDEFKPFNGVIGTILGFMTLVMFMMIALTITIDLAYISLPMFQSLLYGISDTMRASGKVASIFGVEDGKPAFVSPEAWETVKEAERKVGQGYTNPTVIYMKNKSKQMILIFICLGYLMSGQIYEILAFFVDYIGGISEDVAGWYDRWYK